MKSREEAKKLVAGEIARLGLKEFGLVAKGDDRIQVDVLDWRPNLAAALALSSFAKSKGFNVDFKYAALRGPHRPVVYPSRIDS